jgi:diguanylate cyclase (GGDEF)-like protein
MSKRIDPMRAMMRSRRADDTAAQPTAPGSSENYERLVEEYKALQSMMEEQKRLIAELEGGSLADPMTGLANGRTLENELNRSLATARRYGRTHALVLLEIVDFTNLCKQLDKSHPAGPGQKTVAETVLNHTAQLIRQNIRPTDIAARIEDGTFAIIFNELRMSSNATDRAAELSNLLETKPCITASGTLHLFVRTGCRVFSGEDALTDILNGAMEDMSQSMTSAA